MNDKEITPQLEIVETETLYERNNTRLKYLEMILDNNRNIQKNKKEETYSSN